MMRKIPGTEEPIPKWDVALEALVREEYQNKSMPLSLADFQRLARQHAIRFDDIMVTVFELCVNGLWRYQDAQGVVRIITADTLARLTEAGRLTETNLASYTGGWYPGERVSR